MINIRLSRLLGDKRLTQKALADKTGIMPNTIHALFHEKIDRIDLTVLDRICRALDCQPGDILDYSPGEMVRRSGTPGRKKRTIQERGKELK